MKVEISGKNLRVNDRLRERTENKLQKYDKYFRDDITARVIFSHIGGNTQIVEITVPLKGGTILRSEKTTDDMIKSLDGAIDRLDAQLKKHKTSLQKRFRSQDSIRFDEIPSDEPEQEEEFNIVKMKTFPIKPMDPKEAILQMNLLGHSFFVFINSQTGDVNVVYRRNDGDYGLIEPTY